MKKLTVQLRFSPSHKMTVGQLAEVDRRIYFEYDAAFLNGVDEINVHVMY